MSISTRKPVVEQHLVEVPLYTPLDAARYLHLPVWGMLALAGRSCGWPSPEWFFHSFPMGFLHPRTQDDVLDFCPDDDQTRITFRQFAVLFVRAAALETIVEWGKISERSSAKRVNLCRNIWRGLEDSWHAPDLFEATAAEEQLERALAPFSRLDEETLALLRKGLVLRLQRIALEGGLPVRLFPFCRDPGEDSPRLVVLDPRIRFGRPTLFGQGLPTDILCERFQAGDSLTEMAADYDLPLVAIEEAIRYESLRPTLQSPFFGW